MKIKNNFFKENRGKILFSDEVIIYEVKADKEEIFQKINSDISKVIKKLEIYLKKLKKFSEIDIYIDDFYFRKTEIEVLADEVPKEKLETYMEYSAKEFLNESSLEEYFLKYYKKSDEVYVLYIFERNFIEDLIEFFLKNRITAGKILIKDSENEEFSINDYDNLLKRNQNFKIDKRAVILILFVFVGAVIIKFYDLKVKNEIELINKNIIIAEDKVNEIKLNYDELEREVLELEEKLGNLDIKKEYFSVKVFTVLKAMPENIRAENIYYEKNNLNIQGKSLDEESLFEFLRVLEKNEKILAARYDYIINRGNYYEFLLELKFKL